MCSVHQGCRNSNSSSSSNNAYNTNSSQPLASYNLGSLSSGSGAGAITMAAAQAVQATAQVMSKHPCHSAIHYWSRRKTSEYIYFFNLNSSDHFQLMWFSCHNFCLYAIVSSCKTYIQGQLVFWLFLGAILTAFLALTVHHFVNRVTNEPVQIISS